VSYVAQIVVQPAEAVYNGGHTLFAPSSMGAAGCAVCDALDIDKLVSCVPRHSLLAEVFIPLKTPTYGPCVLDAVLRRDAEERGEAFNARPYFRLAVGLISELAPAAGTEDASGFGMLAALASAFHALQPLRVPGFAFSWLELISHRYSPGGGRWVLGVCWHAGQACDCPHVASWHIIVHVPASCTQLAHSRLQAFKALDSALTLLLSCAVTLRG
jgi:CCR4-Not complex component, Not1